MSITISPCSPCGGLVLSGLQVDKVSSSHMLLTGRRENYYCLGGIEESFIELDFIIYKIVY